MANPWDNDPVVSTAQPAATGGNPWDSDPIVSHGTTGSFGEPEATDYASAAAPRQTALSADASTGQKIAAGAGDALSFVGRAIASSPTFLGALHGSGGDINYALNEFYKDLGKKHSDNFLENTLRDPATPLTLPVGGAGGKLASTITKDVIANTAGRVAAKVGARMAGGAVESLPSAAEHQEENVASGGQFDVKKGAEELATGGAMSGAMGTGAEALRNAAKATALKTISAYLRPGQKGARDGFDAENIFKHNLDAASIDGMFKKTSAKLAELKTARDAVKAAGTDADVTIDAPAAFHKAISNLKIDDPKNIYNEDEMKSVADDIKNIWMKKHPQGDIPLSDAMDLKTATGNKAAELEAFDKRGATLPSAKAKVYAEVTKELNSQINKTVEAKGLGDMKSINQQYEEVLPILRAIIRRKPILKSNLPISLQDVAEGAAGAITAPEGAGSWDKTLRALAVMAAGKVAANPKITALLYRNARSGITTKAAGVAARDVARTGLFESMPDTTTEEGNQ